MKRKIVICVIVAIVIGLVIVGMATGVLTGKILPALGKFAKAVPPKMWVGLIFKLLILTGLMGWVTKLVSAKKERFLNGEVEYRLEKDYVLVVGYDFQTKPLIKRLLEGQVKTGLLTRLFRKLFGLPPIDCVLLLTDRDVRKIRAEMTTELSKKEAKCLLYMRKDLALADAYAGLRIRGAKSIFIMGDEGVSGRDGVVLRASEMLAAKATAESKIDADVPVKVYLQFDDPGIYAQMRSQKMPLDCKDGDGGILFELDIFNYYDGWVWKCWSQKDSVDESNPRTPERYLPLRYKPDAERVELFVVGSGKATKAVVDSAITLMNYGADSKCCRLTVVTDRACDVLPPRDAIAELPELEIVDNYSPRDFERSVSAKMLEAASDERCAVTIVIVEDSPEKVVKAYLRLPFALRSRGISVLLWMGSQSRNLPEKKLIKVEGDQTQLRYFGMLNFMPWLEDSRYAGVMDINYYWTMCKSEEWTRVVDKDGNYPKEGDGGLIAAALRIWDEGKAREEWQKTDRWAKWSNINSAGSCKEKATLVEGKKLDAKLLKRLLTAEHNRWWSERLLADWRFAKVKDKVRRLHPDMVPFNDLNYDTQDLDKINIAVMARQGFINAT